jgi:Protein of unknown function (DUF4038)/Domain of unknown function (DUF5060)/Putative collagen-binding domain of a collagenase
MSAFTLTDSSPAVFTATELVLTLAEAPPGNPFTAARFSASVSTGKAVSEKKIHLEGFCDDAHGRVFRLRFMPRGPGLHRLRAEFYWGDLQLVHEVEFTARAARSADGPVRVDVAHPFHFVREGSGARYYPHGTTAYYLLGWDEAQWPAILDRFAHHGVNRLRVALYGRTPDGARWSEPLVRATPEFRFHLEPWVAARPENTAEPGFDLERFNLPHWRRADALLRACAERGIVVSLIFLLDGQDPGVDAVGLTKAGGEAERRYYRYAVARFAACANLMWDVTNEWRNYRTEVWVRTMGAYLRSLDPYAHCISVHGHENFRFRLEPWCDYASYQRWDASGGYWPMLAQRLQQAALGRPMPQINEEYGYEDHYPAYGNALRAPGRDADNRRRLAWEMAFAGVYSTTGERADFGTGAGDDTGGGWINGRGDARMNLLALQRHVQTFFTTIAYWRLEPALDLVNQDRPALAEPGVTYAIYLPTGGTVSLGLVAGRYRLRWFECRTGRWVAAATEVIADGHEWSSPPAPEKSTADWCLLLEASPA